MAVLIPEILAYLTREVGYDTEFRLLSVLAPNIGRVMSREELLDSAWCYNNETTSRTVDVHIAWLRTKLGEGDSPRHIITVRRGGYKLML